jgi:hypothetical protein
MHFDRSRPTRRPGEKRPFSGSPLRPDSLPINAVGARASVYAPQSVGRGAVAAWPSCPAPTNGERAFIGSQNLSATSLDQNRELGIIVADPVNLSRLTQTFAIDFRAAAPLERP